MGGAMQAEGTFVKFHIFNRTLIQHDFISKIFPLHATCFGIIFFICSVQYSGGSTNVGPGIYEIRENILITGSAREFTNTFSDALSVKAGDKVFIRKVETIKSGHEVLTRGKIDDKKWITLEILCNRKIRKFAHKNVVEPYPGVYKIEQKIIITQSATQYSNSYSVGAYCNPGDIVFIRQVKKIESVNGILIRGKIDNRKWITLKNLCYNVIEYAKLEV